MSQLAMNSAESGGQTQASYRDARSMPGHRLFTYIPTSEALALRITTDPLVGLARLRTAGAVVAEAHSSRTTQILFVASGVPFSKH